MDRKEFGSLVAALRKEQYGEGGERLTQANLARLCHQLDPYSPLSEVVIGKIERGERVNLDEQTLLNLADTLKLTIGERRSFFLLATGLDHPQIYPSVGDDTAVLDKVLAMLESIRLPALLLDRYLDIIAVNSLLLPLYQLPQPALRQRAQKPGGTNLLDFIFSADFAPLRQRMSPQVWHRFAVGNVIYFRRVSLPYRMTDYFASLLAHLRRNREFRWFWEQVFYEDKLYFVGGESFQMGSAETGRYRFLTAPLVTVTPYGNLEILAHIPRDRETAVAFCEMEQVGGTAVHQLAPWPEKAWSCCVED